MNEEEKIIKKVKVQIGSNLSTSNAQAVVNGNEALIQTPSFDDVPIVSLATLCDSSYLNRQRKGKRPSTGNIFPASMIGKNKAPTSASKPKIVAQTEQLTEKGPRVEMIDGKIVIKESSLVINGPDSNINEGEYEEIEEGVHASSRYSSFTNRRNPKIWGIEETRMYYDALRQCGTDFSMMQTFFPHRTRKELKLKFYREEKSHPDLVKAALETSLPLDLTPFEIQLGTSLKEDIDTKTRSTVTASDINISESNNISQNSQRASVAE